MHNLIQCPHIVPSVLWCCWLGGRKGIRPVKNMEWWGAGMVICLECGANDLHMVHLMPLPPHHPWLQQNPEWFILLVLAYAGCPGKKAVKRLCVCVSLQKILPYLKDIATLLCRIRSTFSTYSCQWLSFCTKPYIEIVQTKSGPDRMARRSRSGLHAAAFIPHDTEPTHSICKPKRNH